MTALLQLKDRVGTKRFSSTNQGERDGKVEKEN